VRAQFCTLCQPPVADWMTMIVACRLPAAASTRCSTTATRLGTAPASCRTRSTRRKLRRYH
jgi:hypothetical protein